VVDPVLATNRKHTGCPVKPLLFFYARRGPKFLFLLKNRGGRGIDNSCSQKMNKDMDDINEDNEVIIFFG